jgi:uncharacterized protein (UPF0548 family)
MSVSVHSTDSSGHAASSELLPATIRAIDHDGRVSVSVLTEGERAKLETGPSPIQKLGRPVGEHHPATANETITLPADADFDRAAHLLMSWQVQARAGLDVKASSMSVSDGAVLVMRFGWGPLGLSIPCRVVYLINEPNRCGFAYGTLPSHPEAGEELFLLERGHDGSISFTIRAFSRPATALARLCGPVSRAVQRAMTRRYLRAIQSH